MNVHLRVCGFFKKSILVYVERLLNAKIDVNSVEIYVRIKFKEVN